MLDRLRAAQHQSDLVPRPNGCRAASPRKLGSDGLRHRPLLVRVKQTTESQMTTSPTTLTVAPPLNPALQIDLQRSRILTLAPITQGLSHIVMQLAADDIDVITAPKARVAKARLHGHSPTAVLLHPELDDGTGYQALHELRVTGAVDPACPAIAFSERAEPLDRLRALQRGCVDFLAVPIFYPELVARLQIALCRTRPTRSRLHVPGGLIIDQTARVVTLHSQPLHLRHFEYELLAALAVDPARVWTKAELLETVWGHGPAVKTRTVDGHACRLRIKLRNAGGNYVHNLWGIGYRLQPESQV